MLIKVNQKDITLSRLCYYLSESARGTNTKTTHICIYIYICKCACVYIYSNICMCVCQLLVIPIFYNLWFYNKLHESRNTSNRMKKRNFLTKSHVPLNYVFPTLNIFGTIIINSIVNYSFYYVKNRNISYNICI